MPEFPVALTDPTETLMVVLSKLSTRGIWFETSGLTVMVEEVRLIGSEAVILGARVTDDDRPSLNPKKRREVID